MGAAGILTLGTMVALVVVLIIAHRLWTVEQRRVPAPDGSGSRSTPGPKEHWREALGSDMVVQKLSDREWVGRGEAKVVGRDGISTGHGVHSGDGSGPALALQRQLARAGAATCKYQVV